MHVGLFFGSFNPIHVGHLIIAQCVYEQSSMDEVWFVVSPQNPFKKNKSLLHEFDRYDMVDVAIRDVPKFKATDIEFNLSKPNYTINTLTVLNEKYPEHEFKLIIGGDNLAQFKKWKNADQILEHYGLLVYPRPGYEKSELESHPRVELINAPLLDISATYIRSAIKSGRSIKYLVSESVDHHIKTKGFYL